MKFKPITLLLLFLFYMPLQMLAQKDVATATIEQLEQFGDEHMLDILRHTKFKDARHVVELMEAEVERHRKGAEPNDDMTIMCLKALNIKD